MKIMHLAFGGCFLPPPIPFGLTEDTGGHVGYVAEAALAMADLPQVTAVDVVTRGFCDARLGTAFHPGESLIAPRCRVVRLGTERKEYLSKESLDAELPGLARALETWLEDPSNRPDIVHAHFADAALIALDLSKKFGFRVTYTPHSLGLDKARNQWVPPSRLAAENRALSEADLVIVSSRDEAERQVEAYAGIDPGRVRRIPPGITRAPGPDTPETARNLVAGLRHPDRPVILAIARPVQKKNLVGLMRVYGRQAELRDRANLVIVAGQWQLLHEEEASQVHHELQSLRTELGLEDRIALPQRHGPTDVASFYALARESGGVFVNPAICEPFGLTVQEAAAHGVPVIATKFGGAGDIISALEHGMTVDPSDEAALGRAILKLLNDAETWQALSAAGRRNGQNWRWRDYASCAVHAMEELLSPQPAPARISSVLCSDMDATLTGCQTGAAHFARWRSSAADWAFVIATGRSFTEAMVVLNRWALPHPDVLIASGGTEIYMRDPLKGVFGADKAFAEDIAQGWLPDAVEAALEGLKGLTPQPDVEKRRFKRSYFASSPKSALAAEARLKRAGIPCHVVLSHGELLDVIPDRAGKHRAMAHVVRRLGVSPDRVIAAGDSGNDVTMLEAAARGILVANHSDELARLRGLDHIYMAREAYAGGVLEGLEALARPQPEQRGRAA